MKNWLGNCIHYACLCMAALPVSAQDTLTGDWGGTRSQWAESGIEPGLVYTADYFKVAAGGVRREGEYLGNLDLTVSFDGGKLFDIPGATFFLYLLNNHGHDHGGGPGQHAGDYQGVSNIDAPDTTKVYEAWYDQRFAGDAASIRFGLYDLNSEFDVINTAGLFINSSFGIGPDFSQSGQNGPSIFPTTSMALRLAYQLSKSYVIQFAVLDGVPGDPADNKGTHIEFNRGDGLLYVAEVAYVQGGDEDTNPPYAKWALGAWRYSAAFDDISSTDSDGNPLKRKNNQGAYLLGEYTVYREATDPRQGLAVFARYGIANSDINQVGSFFGAGMVYTGLFPGRGADRLGLAVA